MCLFFICHDMGAAFWLVCRYYSLVGLEVLDIHGNLLSELPVALGQLQQLQDLDVSGIAWIHPDKELQHSDALQLYHKYWSTHLSQKVCRLMLCKISYNRAYLSFTIQWLQKFDDLWAQCDTSHQNRLGNVGLQKFNVLLFGAFPRIQGIKNLCAYYSTLMKWKQIIHWWMLFTLSEFSPAKCATDGNKAFSKLKHLSLAFQVCWCEKTICIGEIIKVNLCGNLCGHVGHQRGTRAI